MKPDLLVTTFPILAAFQQVSVVLNSIGAVYKRIDPSPPLSLVAIPALVMTRETRAALQSAMPDISCSGWVEYQIATSTMPDGPAPKETEQSGCFRRAAIIVLRPCIADYKKIRLIAHVEGDLGPVFPYLKIVLPQASYTPTADKLNFMDGNRMIELNPKRITITMAEEIVDAWLTLERIRFLSVQTWNDRDIISPSFETRERPLTL